MSKDRTPLQIVGEIERLCDGITRRFNQSTMPDAIVEDYCAALNIVTLCDDLKRHMLVSQLEASIDPKRQHENWKGRQK